MPVTFLALAASLAAHSQQLPPPLAPTTDISVMSYNVHGLPWPLTVGRPQALRAIGSRLAAMRLEGEQPHLVLLQEAFTGDAKAIAREAGYPYVVEGPTRRDRLASAIGEGARPFRRAYKLKGEADGTFEDSGLLLLSDYPIVDVERMPYQRLACAGFDCLANKGAVLVRVSIPGAAQPLTVVDTHMNSRGASGVPLSRADAAYGLQAEQLHAFVAEQVAPTAPAIVAGDFNIGKTAYRRAMITGAAGVLAGGVDALRTALSQGLPVSGKVAAQAVVSKGDDWMFARSGCSTTLTLKSVSVPFGPEPDGSSLSDHFGYVAHYTFQNRANGCGVPVQTAWGLSAYKPNG